MRKAGISLVALVITIIVLIILTGAVIITGINAPTQANLAVFLNNISTMQDVVSLKMMSNMVEYAAEGNLELFKFVGVVNGYTEQMARDGIAPTFAVVENKANGKEVASLDSSLLSSAKISAEELSKFYIEPTGAIMHEGYILGDIKYYTAKEMVESIPPLPFEATVATLNINSVVIEAETTDNSGSVTYQYSIDDGTTWQGVTENEDGQYVIDNLEEGTGYTIRIRATDSCGNTIEATTALTITTLTPVPIATIVQVGDFVNYDAGIWDRSVDTAKITSSGGTVTWSAELPEAQGQFGAFINGQSRNTNLFQYNANDWTSPYSGWRVWDINGEIVTLISAGNTENYYSNSNIAASQNILRNRDCSMYVNCYANSAEILTGEEALRWYNKNFDPDYASLSAWVDKTFPRTEITSTIEILSHYWFVTETQYYARFYAIMGGSNGYLTYNNGNWPNGIRFLIHLKSDVFVEAETGDGSVENPWRIVE